MGAQINGQKVLLVPKKKPDHPVHTSLSGQVQPGQVRLSSVQSEVRLATLQTARSRNVLIQTAGQTNARVITTLAPPASPLLTSLKQNCLTEIDPNTVQNTNTGSAENPPESNKTNILEQAMHEVFPSDIDFTDQSEETFPDPDGSPQAGDDLYNPMRSPLKNRNKILCEVLGIDS